MNKKYIAEMLGTFILTFSVLCTLLTGRGMWLPAPFIGGMSLILLVFIFGRISGGHFNPAVSIGAWSVGKLKTLDLPFYIVFQIIGAVLAKIAIQYVGSIQSMVADGKNVNIFIAEMAGAILFSLGIASVVYFKDAISTTTPPVIIGLSLFMGLGIAGSLGSLAVLNPAIAIGLNLTSWPYLLGPVLGSIIGFNVYKVLKN